MQSDVYLLVCWWWLVRSWSWRKPPPSALVSPAKQNHISLSASNFILVFMSKAQKGRPVQPACESHRFFFTVASWFFTWLGRCLGGCLNWGVGGGMSIGCFLSNHSLLLHLLFLHPKITGETVWAWHQGIAKDDAYTFIIRIDPTTL